MEHSSVGVKLVLQIAKAISNSNILFAVLESLCIQFYHYPTATLGQRVTCHAMTLPSYPMCFHSLPLSYFIYIGCSIPG